MAATYEEARTDATIARFNVVDADGVSHTDRYGPVAVGDLVEWRRAEDCWTRYQVTSTTLRGGTVWEFGVAWMTYAFTGCGGALAVNAPTTLHLGPLPDLGDPELAYPIRHGLWQFVPKGWTGAVEPTEDRPPAARHDWSTPTVETLFEARRLPSWRDPGVPISWALDHVTVAARDGPLDSYRAVYHASTGATAMIIEWYHVPRSVSAVEAQCLLWCEETRVIAGRPARVSYSPLGPFHDVFHRAAVWVYDPATEVEYVVREDSARLFGGRVDDAVDIARSLFDDEPVKPGSLRYTRSASDDSATPGSHTFLAGTNADAAAVTTYDGLRGAEATALLVHTSDIDGVSHAGFFDALTTGDAFEWWRADDCWIRFRVTGVLPDPPGVEPRKLFAVQSGAFAYTGCMGAVPADAFSYLGFGPLSTLGGPSLDVPVAHGPWRLVPAGWSGSSYAPTAVTTAAAGQFQASDRIGTSDLAEARMVPRWREPVLPAGWTFTGVVGGDLTSTVSGYCATFGNAGRRLAVEVCGTEGLPGPGILEASWDRGAGVREFRTIPRTPGPRHVQPAGPEPRPGLPRRGLRLRRRHRHRLHRLRLRRGPRGGQRRRGHRDRAQPLRGSERAVTVDSLAALSVRCAAC